MSDSDSEDDVPLMARVGGLAKAEEQKKSNTNKQGGEGGGAAQPKSTKPEAKEEKSADRKVVKTETKPKATSMAAKGKATAGSKLKNGVVKKEKKSNAGAGASNGKEVKVKRERKTYEMPGQTKDTPDETDPIRKFYESLSTQKPDSAMAQKWLMQHGMLPKDVAQKLHDKLKRSAQAKKAKASGAAKPRASGANTGTPRGRKKRERDTAFEDGGL